MTYLDWNPHFLAHFDDLRKRGPEVTIFTSDMADVAPTVFFCHARQSQDLLGRGVEAIRILQTRAQPKRTSFHISSE